MIVLTQSSPAVAFLAAFAAVVVFGSAVIEGLRRLKMRQPIGTDAPQPESHQLKQGTPTMGGLLFAVGAFVAITVGFAAGWLPLNEASGNLDALVAVLVLHMGVGFIDDYLKATRGKAMGLKARQKLAGQTVIALGFVVYLAITSVPGVTTTLTVWHDVTINVPPLLYYSLVMILMVGMSNSVNITDGLDGLAAGLAIPAFAGLALAAFGGMQKDVSFFGWAMSGACLGFLVFNGYPARVFMGDTGSLAIGACLAGFAVICKEEVPLLVFCLVYILETLSVFVQVISFKTRGKRIFKMAPVHHHFEMCGWKETQVVQRFWIAGAVLFWLGLIVSNFLSPFNVLSAN